MSYFLNQKLTPWQQIQLQVQLKRKLMLNRFYFFYFYKHLSFIIKDQIAWYIVTRKNSIGIQEKIGLQQKHSIGMHGLQTK